MKTKTNEQQLAALKKANKERKLYMATKAGFKTVEEYKDFLSKPEAISRCFDSKEKETVHIVNLLDLSSSMNEHNKIGVALKGLNSEVAELSKDTNVNYVYSLVTFSYSSEIKKVYNRVNIKKVGLQSYRANGMTALNDALGKTLKDLVDSFSKNKERVVVSVFTDGQENDSKTYRAGDISELVKASKKLGIIVTFIGTQLDTANVIRTFKIDESNTLVHDNTSKGVSDSFASKLGATVSYSASVSRGVKQEDLLTGFYKTTGKL